MLALDTGLAPRRVTKISWSSDKSLCRDVETNSKQKVQIPWIRDDQMIKINSRKSMLDTEDGLQEEDTVTIDLWMHAKRSVTSGTVIRGN